MIFHCNYGRILYRFRNKARYWSKKRQFFIPTCLFLCNHKKHSTFVIFHPAQPNPSKTAKSRPNPWVNPTHGQVCAVSAHARVRVKGGQAYRRMTDFSFQNTFVPGSEKSTERTFVPMELSFSGSDFRTSVTFGP